MLLRAMYRTNTALNETISSPEVGRNILRSTGHTLRGAIAVAALALVFLCTFPVRAGEAGDGWKGGLDLTPWRGKVVLVDFWASWCGPCAQAFPWLAQMQQKYGEQGLVIVSINLDEDREAAETFLRAQPAPYDHVFDPEGALAEAYEVGMMPTALLFDREGHLAARHEGFHNEERALYEERIQSLLMGRSLDLKVADLAGSGVAGGVRSWQRGRLAGRDMWLESDPLDFAIDDHIYFSKEASAGGRGFGGGGCGCN